LRIDGIKGGFEAQCIKRRPYNPLRATEAGTKANIPSRTRRTSASRAFSAADFFTKIQDICNKRSPLM
jgi:hypothetical protein